MYTQLAADLKYILNLLKHGDVLQAKKELKALLEKIEEKALAE